MIEINTLARRSPSGRGAQAWAVEKIIVPAPTIDPNMETDDSDA